VISDQKRLVVDDSLVVSYAAVVLTATDYSPFGVGLYGRNWSEGYRYGFNGKERDNSTGAHNYDFGARIYEGRLGKWLAIDPKSAKYPFTSPFNFVLNSPVQFIDPNGEHIDVTITKNEQDGTTQIHISMNLLIVNDRTEPIDVETAEKLKSLFTEAAAIWTKESIGSYSVSMEINVEVFQPMLSADVGTLEEYKTSTSFDEAQSLVVLSDALASQTLATAAFDGSKMTLNSRKLIESEFFTAVEFNENYSTVIAHEIGHMLDIVFHADKFARFRQRDQLTGEEFFQRSREMTDDDACADLYEDASFNPSYDQTKDDQNNLMQSVSNGTGSQTNLVQGQLETVESAPTTINRTVTTQPQ